MTIPAKLFEEPAAGELAVKRALARKRHRITYDCMNAIVQADEVVCKLGYSFPRPGPRSGKGTKTTMPLVTALRGDSSRVCQACSDYDGEEIE